MPGRGLAVGVSVAVGGMGDGVNVVVGGTGEAVYVGVGGTGKDVIIGAAVGGMGLKVACGAHPTNRVSSRSDIHRWIMLLTTMKPA